MEIISIENILTNIINSVLEMLLIGFIILINTGAAS
jgi:hypothetical protein